MNSVERCFKLKLFLEQFSVAIILILILTLTLPLTLPLTPPLTPNLRLTFSDCHSSLERRAAV